MLKKKLLDSAIAGAQVGGISTRLRNSFVKKSDTKPKEKTSVIRLNGLEKQRKKTVKRAISSFKQQQKWVEDNKRYFYSVDNMCIFLYNDYIYIQPKNLTELLETNKSNQHFSKKLMDMTYTLKFKYQDFIELLEQFYVFLVDHLRITDANQENQKEIDQMYEDIFEAKKVSLIKQLDNSKCVCVTNIIEITIQLIGVVCKADKRNNKNFVTEIPSDILGDNVTESNYGWIGNGKYFDHLDKSIDLAIFMSLVYIPTSTKLYTSSVSYDKDYLNSAVTLVHNKDYWR